MAPPEASLGSGQVKPHYLLPPHSAQWHVTLGYVMRDHLPPQTELEKIGTMRLSQQHTVYSQL